MPASSSGRTIKSLGSTSTSTSSSSTASSTSGAVVLPDLRRYGNIRNTKTHFDLSDINYASGYDDNSFRKVPKMIVIEKQPKYPIYTEASGDFVNTIKEKIKSGVVSKLLGASGDWILGQAGEAVGKSIGNTMVSRYSNNPSELWSNQSNYLNHFENMFITESKDGILTYELPFFSDYFFDADGESGWRRVGSEAMLGDIGKMMAKYANVGYPSTPNWEYDPHFPKLSFKFHLINDTDDHLKQNVRFLTSILPGMMFVLINQTDGKTIVSKMMGDITSTFKSPNVYEVMVPGRFRWLWSTMSMDIRCVGKIYSGKDALSELANAFNTDLAGMPEVFEIEVSINSLVPAAFNTYVYFLSQKNDSGSSQTERDSLETIADLDKLTNALGSLKDKAIETADKINKSTNLPDKTATDAVNESKRQQEIDDFYRKTPTINSGSSSKDRALLDANYGKI